MLRFEKDRKGCGVYVDYGFYVEYGFYVDGVVLATTKVLFAKCRLFARYSVPRNVFGDRCKQTYFEVPMAVT